MMERTSVTGPIGDRTDKHPLERTHKKKAGVREMSSTANVG